MPQVKRDQPEPVGKEMEELPDMPIQRPHVIYGLVLQSRPRDILYVGSWQQATLGIRLEQHRSGACRVTAKAARREGVSLAALEIRVLRVWIRRKEPNPERRIQRLCRAFGMNR